MEPKSILQATLLPKPAIATSSTEEINQSSSNTENTTPGESSINVLMQGVLPKAKLLAAQKPNALSAISLINDLTSSNTIPLLKRAALDYINSFQYKPIEKIEGNNVTYKSPVKFTLDEGTLDKVTNLVVEALLNSKITPQVLERVLFKPQVLAKLAVVYEHGFMLGANKDEEKEQLVKKLINQYATDDAAMRFIQSEMPYVPSSDGKQINVYNLVMSNPELYSKIEIAHRWVCRKLDIDPNDTEKQKISKTPITNEITKLLTSSNPDRALNLMLANLRQNAPIPLDKSINIGESLFFKPLIDDKTLAPSQFLLDAFERGIKNVEFGADLLPFDPTKRLAGEYTEEEIGRIRELGKTLGLTLTVHSPIVGPLHPKTNFTAVLEDASDNVQLMKDTVDFASWIGAKTVVVHISDRNSDDAIKNYADIACHAVGKYASDGKPLRIGFENYMNKALPGGVKPFPTMEEHFEPFAKIVKQIVKNSIDTGLNPTEALKHCALLLDSAHFNLVTNMQDPLSAVEALPKLVSKLGSELVDDKDLAPKLKETNFDLNKFANSIICELHLNQNIGPIGFTVPNKDYNADIHNPVESIGTIDNIGFVSLVQDSGLGENIVILAEQKKPLSPAGLQILYNATKQTPGIAIPKGEERVNYFKQSGEELIQEYKINNPERYEKIKSLLETETGKVHSYYAYIAGRLGLDHLLEHIQKRAFHNVLGAQADLEQLENLDSLPVNDVKLENYENGALIIKRGTTLEEAKKEGSNNFYLVAKGSVIVQLQDGKSFELKTGAPFGEAMFLTGAPRSADVVAGQNGTTVVQISEEDFWTMYNMLVPFQERLDIHSEKRSGGIIK